MRIDELVEIGARTTYRVGGRARFGLTIEGESDARAAHQWCSEHGLDTVIIGRGSNTVVADGDLELVAIDIDAPTELDCERVGDVWHVTASATWALPQLARQLAENAVGGFEWAVGVPGSLGGAVAMNAGGHGGEMSQCVTQVRVLDLADGSLTWMSRDYLDFGYRHSSLSATQVVLMVKMTLHVGSPEELRERMAQIVSWRREHQPGGRNAGSVFRNPPGDHAARLIDEAGLKGARVGGAEVSTKHANFIQALDGATGRDVRDLVRHVQKVVAATTGVELRTEIKFVGFAGES